MVEVQFEQRSVSCSDKLFQRDSILSRSDIFFKEEQNDKLQLSVKGKLNDLLMIDFV